MLALLVPAPFHRPGLVFEEKYERHPNSAYKEGRQGDVLSETTSTYRTFTDIAAAIGQLRESNAASRR